MELLLAGLLAFAPVSPDIQHDASQRIFWEGSVRPQILELIKEINDSGRPFRDDLPPADLMPSEDEDAPIHQEMPDGADDDSDPEPVPGLFPDRA